MDAPTGKALLYARVSTAMQVEDGVVLLDEILLKQKRDRKTS